MRLYKVKVEGLINKVMCTNPRVEGYVVER